MYHSNKSSTIGSESVSEGSPPVSPSAVVFELPMDSDTEETQHPIQSLPTIPINLLEVRLAIDAWHTAWGPEVNWDRNFNTSLRRAQDKGRKATDRFFEDCETHTHEGHSFLKTLRRLAQEAALDNRVRKRGLLDLYLQILDLHTLVLSEVKFYEVKLNEYTPTIPLSKISDIRTYQVA